MSVAINQKVESVIGGSTDGNNWQDNLSKMVDRRLQVYEIIMPYRVAAEALKFQSTILLNRHMDIVRDERQSVCGPFYPKIFWMTGL